MKERTTDLQKIIHIACELLYVPIKPVSEVEIFTCHPFTSTTVVMVNRNDKHTMLNLLNPEQANEWRQYVRSKIESVDNVKKLSYMINKPYILLFLKLCKKYLSAQDLAMLLYNHWSEIEYISTDVNVSVREMVSLFREADRQYLMSEEEQEVYSKLKNDITVYRGVTDYNEKNKKALSWTLDYEKAKWFATRFNSKKHMIWKTKVKKDQILCYMNGRGEKEVILDLGRRTVFEVEDIVM